MSVFTVSMWEAYDAFLNTKDGERQWRIYAADNFGPDMVLISCDKYTESVRAQMDAAGARFLGAAVFIKDKKTGEDKPTQWHWLGKIA